jgi:GAF domain-containing protein
MKRRSRGGGEPVKARRRTTATSKRHNAPKSARRRSSSAAGQETNVKRLTRERDEALEQQTATAEVLKVISRSAFDLRTVLDTLLQSAARLCEADKGTITQRKGDTFYRSISYGFPAAFAGYVKDRPVELGHDTATGRALLEGKVIHIPDVEADPNYAWKEAQRLGTFRTILGVPMLREGIPVGVLALARSEVRPFTDKQIELVATFADQAVIAIENVRLFEAEQQRTRELSESLQQRTATADVLKVISRSTFDLQTVLNTLVESAARLCEADMASINREKGAAYQQVANYGHSPELQAYMISHPIPAGHGSVVGRVVMEGGIIHIRDVLAEPGYKMTEAAKLGGIRTMLGVPLLREGTPIGVIVLQRKAIRPFTEKQIELVETFADQAVIAIENVRLFESVEARTRELAKSLEDLRTAQDRLVQTEKLASRGSSLRASRTRSRTRSILSTISQLSRSNSLTNCGGHLEAPTSTTSCAQRSARSPIHCKAISTRSCSTASAPTRSSRTCFCIRVRAPESTGRSISTPWSMRASISPITGHGLRSKASSSPLSGPLTRLPVRSMCSRRRLRGRCLT